MNECLKQLKSIFSEDQIITGTALESRYTHIWTMHESLNAQALLLPNSTEDVSAMLKICFEFDQPLVLHGGLTNLVGGTESSATDIVMSLERMNAIKEIDVQSRTVTAEAGVLLESLQNSVKGKDMLFPLNFGAKGSAQVGGFVSTNAGGLRVFRYGMTRDLILGLEAVLANGTIISSMKKIIKNNSGYDLKQLFIGSEGTLGVVTKVVFKIIEKPKSRISSFVGINTYDNVVKFLKFMDRGMAGLLSGFELIWGETYSVMTSNVSGVKKPLPDGFKYYVLLEGLGSNQENDQLLLMSLLEESLNTKMIEDAVPAYAEADHQWFFRIREDVHVLKSQVQVDQHFDISLPIPLIGDYFQKAEKKLRKIKGVEEVFIFGHVADGNIHIIVGKSSDDTTLTQHINDVVYNPLKDIGGSVSAEHGIGLHKKRYLHLCRTEEEIDLMKTMKLALDPKSILNPRKIFD